MREFLDIILMLIMILNGLLLVSSRLSACIRLVSLQGVIIGILPLFVHEYPLGARNLLLSAVTIAVKGVIFPWFLFRTIRQTNTGREVNPLLNYPVSLVIGVILFMISVWVSYRLPLPFVVCSRVLIPVAFSTILIGLFTIMTRLKAVTQVLGYLVLENGIYLFSIALLIEQPVIIELGILLDIFVGVFVMGILIFHIGREFEHIDTEKLDTLADWPHESSEVKEAIKK